MSNRLDINDNAHSDNEKNVRGVQYRHKNLQCLIGVIQIMFWILIVQENQHLGKWRPRHRLMLHIRPLGQNHPALVFFKTLFSTGGLATFKGFEDKPFLIGKHASTKICTPGCGVTWSSPRAAPSISTCPKDS